MTAAVYTEVINYKFAEFYCSKEVFYFPAEPRRRKRKRETSTPEEKCKLLNEEKPKKPEKLKEAENGVARFRRKSRLAALSVSTRLKTRNPDRRACVVKRKFKIFFRPAANAQTGLKTKNHNFRTKEAENRRTSTPRKKRGRLTTLSVINEAENGASRLQNTREKNFLEVFS
ncbi:MAG: hypothetical protein FWD39_06390 [Clostridiales bacterium]|nr:hypothetical protein [Clostridiales bacterium]